MKKFRLVLVLAVAMLLSGCDIRVLEVPDELEETYKEAAATYLSDKYPELVFDSTQARIYDTRSSTNGYSICVSFKAEDYDAYVDVWNVMSYPLDNAAEILYSDAAYELIYGIAEEVFGYDIMIKPLTGSVIGSKDTPVYTDVNDFLSNRGTSPFILGFIGSEAGKRALIDVFIAALNEAGIHQDFVCCLYSDLTTMKQDLKESHMSTFVSGDYTNWISVIDDKASDWLIDETKGEEK